MVIWFVTREDAGICAMTVEEKKRSALEQVTEKAKRHAERSGFTLQPDEAQLRYVLNGLADNLVKYGRPFCPCREVTGDFDTDRRNICPCRTHRREIAQSGACECGLFTGRSESKE
jgi:ferredoxin-thioredoxin reductase catalytic subunit